MPRAIRAILSPADLGTAARRHLPRPLFAYGSGGAERDWSRRGNRAGFAAPIRPPTPRLALDVLLRPRRSLGTLVRTPWCNGVRHFENAGPERGMPVITRQGEAQFLQRDHPDWTLLERLRRIW